MDSLRRIGRPLPFKGERRGAKDCEFVQNSELQSKRNRKIEGGIKSFISCLKKKPGVPGFLRERPFCRGRKALRRY